MCFQLNFYLLSAQAGWFALNVSGRLVLFYNVQEKVIPKGLCHFYRTMHYVHSAVLLSVCLIVRPSVTLKYGGHVGLLRK